jgi:hypothetical protein
VDIPESAGILISEKEIETGLEGQFRVLHPLLDSKGVMRFFGSWGGKPMFAAKRYKMDPGGGWTMEERSEIAGLDGPAKSAATNRHARLLAPYFQDCLMQEKAAEFGRAFNKVYGPNPPPRPGGFREPSNHEQKIPNPDPPTRSRTFRCARSKSP